MYGLFSTKTEKFTWKDLKHVGVVNLEGKPSLGIQLYSSYSSSGGKPIIERDTVTGIQMITNLNSVGVPEPVKFKITSNDFKRLEIDGFIYDFMQYTGHYLDLRKSRPQTLLNITHPFNPLNHYNPMHIIRVPRELRPKSKNDMGDRNDTISHDDLMQHLENLEEKEILTKNDELEKPVTHNATKVKKMKRALADMKRNNVNTGETFDEEGTAKKMARTEEETNFDSSEHEDDTESVASETFEDAGDLLGVSVGNDSRDGFASDGDGAFYE